MTEPQRLSPGVGLYILGLKKIYFEGAQFSHMAILCNLCMYFLHAFFNFIGDTDTDLTSTHLLVIMVLLYIDNVALPLLTFIVN